MATFWEWFIKGSAGSGGTTFPGYRCLLGCWLLVHLAVGVLAALFIEFNVESLATVVGGILSALALGVTLRLGAIFYDLQKTKEIKVLMDGHPGGHEFYPYNYQLSLLIVSLTIVVWGGAALGLLTKNVSLYETAPSSIAVPFVLYFMLSMSLRSAYSFALVVNTLTVARRTLEKLQETKDQAQTE